VSKSRPRCLILDAGPVIGLHELCAWEAFVERYEVVLPQLVLDDEALFHSKEAGTGFTQPIDLAADVEAGRVRVAAANLTAISLVASRFTDAIELHDGELEALALLTQDDAYEDYVFCSADGAAIEGACMLGLTDRCAALEDLLSMAGLSRPVSWRFTRVFAESHKRKGSEKGITGFGLAG